MKRTIIILTLLASIFIVSCDNSIEKQIEREFKEWVKVNYDDPKAFKDVVSVELIDTTSLHMYAGMAQQYLGLIPQLDSLEERTSERFKEESTKLTSNKNQFDYSEKKKIERSLYRIYDLTIENMKLIPAKRELTEKVDSVVLGVINNEDVQIYNYEVKVRNSVNGELKLHTFHAYLYGENIKIQSYDMKVSEFPEEFTEIIECLDELNEFVPKYQKNIFGLCD